MALFSTLPSLSQTAGSNAADGASDAPSTIDNQLNLLASFIAQLRDGIGFKNGVGNLGQCRLTKSGANLLLSPYAGNGLTINGTAYAIPSAGVTLAPTALTPGTTYFIYAYMVSTTMTLEASTTGHSTDTTTGVEIKTGDATRTLVGMARPTTGPAWIDASNQRFVISWFNRRPVPLGPTVLGTDQGNVGTSYSEISSGFRNEFLTWGDGRFAFDGAVYNNVALAVSSTTLALDAAVVDTFSAGTHASSNAINSFSVGYELPPSTAEGYHYVSPFARQNVASTASYIGSGTAGFRCVHRGSIQG